jgi:hypothetical protein
VEAKRCNLCVGQLHKRLQPVAKRELATPLARLSGFKTFDTAVTTQTCVTFDTAVTTQTFITFDTAVTTHTDMCNIRYCGDHTDRHVLHSILR